MPFMTLIVVATEFGRPPDFDGQGGRGHQSAAFSAALFGGGLRTGQVIGATDELGRRVVERPISVPDFHATIMTALGMNPATYYIPAQSHEGFLELSRAWKTLERVNPNRFEYPHFHPMHEGDVVWLHRQLAAKAFRVNHTLPSLGYTLFDVRKKLKPEFHGRPGPELARLRKEGVSFEEELWLPRLTYIGDSTIETLYREQHIGQSRILIIELTFLMDDDRELARRRGHTHLLDLADFLSECPDVLQNRHIVLKHFSMRYDRRFIVHTVKSRLPKDFLERVHILI